MSGERARIRGGLSSIATGWALGFGVGRGGASCCSCTGVRGITGFGEGAGASAGGANGSVSTPSNSQGASLQITGQVAVENRFVKMGAYHTLDLESNKDVKITKVEWDSVALDRVHEACQEGRGAEVGAIVCGEGEIPIEQLTSFKFTHFRHRP